MKIEKYGIFETEISDVKSAGLLEHCAVFTNGAKEIHIPAFKNGEDRSLVRFMPQETGLWHYRITLCGKEITGDFECVENTGNNHGPVITEDDHFRYADGATYIPVGTTAYAWIHQTQELQEQTLATLAESPFNKIRMCVFPKSMPYNNNDPDCYPFFKNEEDGWDVSRPDPKFWDKLDKRLRELMDLGIEADLIIFHPYDRWGFAELSQEASLTYLEYCIARLSAYRNLWWSLANEYEMLTQKDRQDWDAYGEMLKEKDIYGHLISIHDIVTPYPKRSWMTHCSIQSKEINKLITWKHSYGIPVIIDECGYEGDLAFNWGSLSAREMVHSFWWTICRGGFCTHGETFHREDEVLWWAKGGRLIGESVRRIAFMKELLYQLPGPWSTSERIAQNPNQEAEHESDAEENKFIKILQMASPDERESFFANVSPMIIHGEKYFLQYLGRMCSAFTELMLDMDKKYRIEIIDTWEMTRKLAAEGVTGMVKVGLPAKEGIAVLVTEL